jgi:hypothetical protein
VFQSLEVVDQVPQSAHSAQKIGGRDSGVSMYSDFVILSMSPALMAFVFIPTNGMTAEVHRDLEAASKGAAIA